MRKKIFVLSCLFTLSGLLSFLPTVYATEKIEVILHEVLYLDVDQVPDFLQNTGLEITEGEFVDGAITKRLNGVTIEAYDASIFIEQKIAEGLSLPEIADVVMNTTTKEMAKVLSDQQVAMAVTQFDSGLGENGIARFWLDETDAVGNYKTYIFLQTNLVQADQQTINLAVAPLLVTLPVHHPETENVVLSTVHLYPKITGTTNDVPVTPEPNPEPPVEPEKPSTGLLPQTGEVKTVVSLVGIAMLGIVISVLTKNKKRNEK